MMLYHEKTGTQLFKGSTQLFYFDAPIVDEIMEVEVSLFNHNIALFNIHACQTCTK